MIPKFNFLCSNNVSVKSRLNKIFLSELNHVTLSQYIMPAWTSKCRRSQKLRKIHAYVNNLICFKHICSLWRTSLFFSSHSCVLSVSGKQFRKKGVAPDGLAYIMTMYSKIAQWGIVKGIISLQMEKEKKSRDKYCKIQTSCKCFLW